MPARILLLLGSVALTLGALEVVLARFAPQRTMSYVMSRRAAMYRLGAYTTTELRPNFSGHEYDHDGEFDIAVRINSLGYRQAEFDPRKGAATRLVAIGDSFTFGHGVEEADAWPRVLEGLLAARGGGAVEVINAGVDGRWVDEYYLELKRRSLALEPDLVMVGFFIGNDIDGKQARTHRWTAVDDRGRPLRIEAPTADVYRGYRVERPLQVRWRFPVLRDSHVAQVLFAAWNGIAELWEAPPVGEDVMYAPVYAPETERAVARVEDLFLAMDALCRGRGARLFVVIIPTLKQVNPEGPNGPGAPDWEKPQRLFAAFFAEHDIPFIDLLPALRAATAEEPVYFRFDAHWTPRGHVVVAQAIAEHLLRQDLVRAPAR